MLKNFRTYQLAVAFYRSVQGIKLPYFLKDQLLRAASSCALNTAEGNARASIADRKRFFRIAYSNAKECQAVLDLVDTHHNAELLDSLAGHLYCLIKSLER